MGQEITARMKYRKIVKKKLFSVLINFKTKLDTKIFSNNEEIGELFSHNKNFGIAYIRTDFDETKTKKLFVVIQI